jgi:glycosyltransferase involved in cell wall biosynthesis
VPGDQLPGLYRAAAGVIFPSLYEGFGLPPLEAMACGCPVAVSDAGALPEVVGDAAIRFDPRDPEAIAGAMKALWDGEQATEPGLERARTFSWGVAAQRHRAIYERAAATSPPAARS